MSRRSAGGAVRRFRWLDAGLIPAAYDLRRCGWILFDSCSPDRAPTVGLLESGRRDPKALVSPGQRPATLLLGIPEPSRRADLLRAGFGDVLGPSPDIGELEARAARIIARLADQPAARRHGELVVDLLARDGFVAGRAVGLHPREFALLWRLMQVPGEPLEKARLLTEVWHLQHVPETNSLPVHVSRLRRKLAAAGYPDVIATRGGGYAYVPPALPLGPHGLDDYVRLVDEPARTAAVGRTMRQAFRNNDRVSLELGANGVAQVRLTRSDKLNALDRAMFDSLIAVGQALFETPGLRAVVLAGEGKGFCAGLDLASLSAPGELGEGHLSERTHGNANLFQQVALQWRKLPVPVIAAVHGVCFGGGLQIAGGADLRVVAPDARLAVMEVKWGIVPDMGGFALWRGLVREDRLRMLTYTAEEFSGEEALAHGFATLVDRDPLARATALAAAIAERSPSAVRTAKALFNRSADASIDEILTAESVAQQRLLGSRNQREAVASGLERRSAGFTDP